MRRATTRMQTRMRHHHCQPLLHQTSSLPRCYRQLPQPTALQRCKQPHQIPPLPTPLLTTTTTAPHHPPPPLPPSLALLNQQRQHDDHCPIHRRWRRRQPRRHRRHYLHVAPHRLSFNAPLVSVKYVLSTKQPSYLVLLRFISNCFCCGFYLKQFVFYKKAISRIKNKETGQQTLYCKPCLKELVEERKKKKESSGMIERGKETPKCSFCSHFFFI